MSILRSAFGPSKDEIWTQIATDIGGEFIEIDPNAHLSSSLTH